MPDSKKNFQEAVISPDATMLDALKAIDRSSLQIALITDGEGRLAGTVTDGDVRRAIIAGKPLETPVASIMNKSPKTIDLEASSAEVLSYMSEKAVHQVPVVDKSGHLAGLQTLDELVSKKTTDTADIPVMLMLGGEGRRLRPLTEEIPKPMIKVGGRPLLETILSRFTTEGFRRFFFSVNYKADVIEKHFGDGSDFGADITYIRETQKTGTAGALAMLPPDHPGPFIVMNGDILTNNSFSHLIEYHNHTGAVATMCVSEYRHQIPYGIVETKGTKLGQFREKPSHSYFVNAGIYVLEPEALRRVPEEKPFDMPHLFEALAEEGFDSSVFPLRDYWTDIGNMEDLKRARSEYGKVFG